MNQDHMSFDNPRIYGSTGNGGVMDVEIGDKTETSCVSFSASFLIVINVLTSLLGLGLAGFGTYVWTDNDQFAAIISPAVIVVVMCLGAIIFLASFVGIYGATKRSKPFLIGYGVFVFLCLIAVVVSTFLIANYLGILGSVSNSAANANGITSDTEKTINDILYSSYDVCCLQNENFCSPLVVYDNYCEPIEDCDDASTEDVACYANSNGNPVGPEFCLALNLTGLLGRVEPNGPKCGGGNPKKFQQDVTQYLSTNISYMYYAVGFVSAIEMLNLIFCGIIILQSGRRVQKIRNVKSNNNAPSVRGAESVRASFDARSGLQIAQPVDDRY